MYVTTSKDINGSLATSVFYMAFGHGCFGFPFRDLKYHDSSTASKDQNHFVGIIVNPGASFLTTILLSNIACTECKFKIHQILGNREEKRL